MAKTVALFSAEGAGVNPFIDEVQKLDKEIAVVEAARVKDQEMLDIHLSFNLAVHEKIIADLQTQLKVLNDRRMFSGLDHVFALRKGSFSRMWGAITGSNEREEKALADQRKKANDEINAQIADCEAEIKKHEALIFFNKAFDEYELRANVKTLDCQIEIIHARRAPLFTRAERLDKACAELFKRYAQLEDEASFHEQNMCDARRFEEALDANPDSAAARRAIHEECAERFYGNGKPIAVRLESMAKAESIRRRMKKIQEEVELEIRKMDLEIKRVFIDGNNLCNKIGGPNKPNVFIGTKPIEALATELLAQGYKVTVVFDPKIGPGRKEVPFDRVMQNFEEAVVLEQAPPDMNADRFLFTLANEPTDCIVSNDKMDEFCGDPLFRDGRLFRAVIGEHIAAIPMLDIKETYITGLHEFS